jgi:hypothetical protein
MDAGSPAPVTTANPPGETHTGALSVVLTSTPAATISYTTDGTDPRTSATAQSGASPVIVTLNAPAQVTLTFSASNAMGTETPHAEVYTLLQDLQPASISGALIVPPSLQSGSAAVLLFNEDPTTATNPMPIQLTTVSPGAPGGAQYVFQGLPAGTYWVAAEWWAGAASGSAQAIGLAKKNPISLNPTTQGDMRADFVNVYIGQCDPAGPGVDGVVNVGTELQSEGVVVYGFNQPLDVSMLGMPVAAAPAIGTGAIRPFALCPSTDADMYVIAEAVPAGAHSPTAYAASAANPIVAIPTTHISIDLGTSSSTEGSLAGTVILNGPLPGGTVSVAISPEPWTIGQLFLASTATLSDPTDYAYTIEGVPPGTYYPLVSVTSADGYSAYFPASAAITVSGALAVMQNLDASVGRITGMVSIGNVPAGSGKVAVAATPVGGTQPAATTQISLGPVSNGVQSGSFVIFGLPDGTYSVTAIVDVDGNGDYADAITKGDYSTAMTTPTVTNGGTATLNFTFTL